MFKKFTILMAALLLLLSACKQEERLKARKESDPRPPAPYVVSRDSGQRCGCYDAVERPLVGAFYVSNQTSTDLPAGNVHLWRTIVTHSTGATTTAKVEIPEDLPANGRVFLGCSRELNTEIEENSCANDVTFLDSEPSTSFVSHLSALRGSPNYSINAVSPVLARPEEFICEKICAESGAECASFDLPDDQFSAMRNALSLVSVAPNETTEVDINELGTASGIDLAVCNRESIIASERGFSNRSADDSACTIEAATDIGTISVTYPRHFSGFYRSQSSKAAFSDLTGSPRPVLIDHHTSISVLNGQIDYLSTNQSEIHLLIRGRNSRHCVRVR